MRRSVLIPLAVILALRVLWAANAKEVPEKYRKMKNPLKPSSQLLKSARMTLYEQHCVYCHGESGKGDGEKMVVKKGQTPPNFTTEQFAKRSDQWIMWRVSEGVPETKMAAFKDIVSEKDRWTLVLLVRSFGPKNAEAKGRTK